ncbi:MAG: Rrf2 family transcriptional regulator [bacterium]
MRISTRGRYATRALLHLATKYGKSPVSLKIISIDQEISVKYLENIMRLLVKVGLVKSTKGKNGGFVLAKAPEDINLSEIVTAAEGSIDPVFCVSDPASCSRARFCSWRDVWSELKLRTMEYMNSITLADMLERQNMKAKIKVKNKSKKK